MYMRRVHVRACVCVYLVRVSRACWLWVLHHAVGQVQAQWRKYAKTASMLNNRIASYLNRCLHAALPSSPDPEVVAISLPSRSGVDRRYHTTANNLKTIECHWHDTFKVRHQSCLVQPTCCMVCAFHVRKCA